MVFSVKNALLQYLTEKHPHSCWSWGESNQYLPSSNTNYVFLQQVSLIIQIGAFCVAQLKVEIQEGVHVGDQSWSRQLNCHWLKMLSTACHNFVFLVWYSVKPPSFIKKCAVSFRSGQKWFQFSPSMSLIFSSHPTLVNLTFLQMGVIFLWKRNLLSVIHLF